MEIPEPLYNSNGMGVFNRYLRCLSSYPHQPSVKEVPTVHPQVSNLPVHLSSLRPSHSPTNLYNGSKGSEVYGSLQRAQNSPIHAQLAYQGPISGRGTTAIASQSELEISLVVGHHSLVIDHFSSPRVVTKPCQCAEGLTPSFQRPQYPYLYRCLKCRLGRSLILHINVLEMKAVFLALNSSRTTV